MFFRILTIVFVGFIAALPAGAAEDLHAEFDLLLSVYATENGVRYEAWAESPEDMQRLNGYIDHLEAVALAELEPAEALAYWINLYNAVTLELVLSHYPVDSIKETAGFLKSPWKKKLVTVGGTKLSLNAIENDVIRPQFQDARIHFALNCASVGCPPLAGKAYRGGSLDDQLDHACRHALNDPRWVRIENDRLVLNKIFDWYREDFDQGAGSVLAFIARYRDDGDRLAKKAGTLKIKHADYDWSLNQCH